MVGLQCKDWIEVATPEKVLMGEQLQWVGRDEVISGKDTNMQLHRPIPEPIHKCPTPMLPPSMIGKHQSLAYLVGIVLKTVRSHLNNGHCRSKV